MQTEHIFVIWICIRIKGEVSRELNLFKPPVVFPPNIPRRFLSCNCSLCFGVFICGFFVIICSASFRFLLCFVIVSFSGYLHLYF